MIQTIISRLNSLAQKDVSKQLYKTASSNFLLRKSKGTNSIPIPMIMITPINKNRNSELNRRLFSMCAPDAFHMQKTISKPNRTSYNTSPFLKECRRTNNSPATKKTRFTANIKEDTLMKSAGFYPVLSRNIILKQRQTRVAKNPINTLVKIPLESGDW